MVFSSSGVKTPTLPFPFDRKSQVREICDNVFSDVSMVFQRTEFPEMIDELEEKLVIIQLAVTALFELRGELIAEAAKGVNHGA